MLNPGITSSIYLGPYKMGLCENQTPGILDFHDTDRTIGEIQHTDLFLPTYYVWLSVHDCNAPWMLPRPGPANALFLSSGSRWLDADVGVVEGAPRRAPFWCD